MSETPDSGRRPPELDNREWLRARYERFGDDHIALDLSLTYKRRISRMMVRGARERLGILSLPPGRRRLAVAPQAGRRQSAEAMIVEQVAEERRLGTPPTFTTIAERVRGLSRAASRREGLIALEAAVRLALDHELALEAA